ncbi:hypothetical protein ACJRPK_17430 [Aquimarina sp. 2-A2]|uniref:hypothetical protein n=1 Tax=Aquimarina sp. 2-A2 TaxID=3382644 RepID=UPI00387F074B
MEKSIESIWKEGFLKSDALVAPKLNDLYNQKSINTIDKLMRMGRMNLVIILFGATVILLGSIYLGTPFSGAILFVQFMWLVIYGKSKADKINNIDKGLSSYQYIIAVDKLLKETIMGYVKIYRFFYPTFFIVLIIGIWSSNYGEVILNKIIEKYPDVYLYHGLPIYFIIGVILIASLMSIFAGKIYKIDLNLVYGHVFKKLDEILMDMEELKR